MCESRIATHIHCLERIHTFLPQTQRTRTCAHAYTYTQRRNVPRLVPTCTLSLSSRSLLLYKYTDVRKKKEEKKTPLRIYQKARFHPAISPYHLKYYELALQRTKDKAATIIHWLDQFHMFSFQSGQTPSAFVNKNIQDTGVSLPTKKIYTYIYTYIHTRTRIRVCLCIYVYILYHCLGISYRASRVI